MLKGFAERIVETGSIWLDINNCGYIFGYGQVQIPEEMMVIKIYQLKWVK
jgi:hypothetical protein